MLERGLVDLDYGYHKIFYETCDEFERVREICLQEEDNWLIKNYTKENLVIEDHTGYCVVYETATDEPMIMGGVFNDSRWPKNIGRMLNRAFVFQNFRRKSVRQLVNGYKLLHHHLIFPLIEVNNYDAYFITMQNRDKKSTKRWWDVWNQTMNAASNNYWTVPGGYLQTCPHMVQKCWQNFVYADIKPGTFAEWNPQILTQEEWDDLIPGD